VVSVSASIEKISESLQSIDSSIEAFTNSFCEIRNYCSSEVQSVESASKQFEEARDSVHELSTAIEDIRRMGLVSDEIREKVERIKTISLSTETALEDIGSTFDDVKRFSKNIEVNINKQTQTVTTVTEKIANVDSAAQEATRFTHESTNGLTEISNQMRGSNQAAKKTLKSMNATSESIGDLVNLSQSLQRILKNYTI
jgi:methyl-accepting chemotaxis protein